MNKETRKSNDFRIGTVLGIPVEVSISLVFPLLVIPLLQIPDWNAVATTAIQMILIFSIVFAHELGHAIMGKSFGMEVQRIRLMIFGGTCYMDVPFGAPGAQLAITIAGPFVNLLILTGALALEVNRGGTLVPSLSLSNYDLNDPITYLIVFNTVMLAVNLLPAHPLDGGRIFQAILHLLIGRRKAVTIACGVSLVVLAIAAVLCWNTQRYFYLILIPLLAMASIKETQANLQALKQEELADA